MKILIQGAGIGGCASAIVLSNLGHEVTVVEQRLELFTDGAGILLYSNALKFIDHLGVLDNVLKHGAVMEGKTEFYSMNSELLGYVNYESVDPKYPAYVGINRNRLLRILYDKAVSNNVKFMFACSINLDTLNGSSDDLISLTNEHTSKYDLILACDGTNSVIRNKLIKDSKSKYTGYGLWHSLHKRHPLINEKVTVIGDNCRMGIIPLNDETMYIWASKAEPQKIHIEKKDQPKVMREKFSCFTGFMGDIINEIDDSTYVHLTCVEEVDLPKPWHYGNVIFLGDSAHASLPFMAQGGAQALHDSVSLGQILEQNKNLEESLIKYSEFRYEVAKLVQKTSSIIGSGYQNTTVDLVKVKQSLDSFYKNKNNFILPKEIL